MILEVKGKERVIRPLTVDNINVSYKVSNLCYYHDICRITTARTVKTKMYPQLAKSRYRQGTTRRQLNVFRLKIVNNIFDTLDVLSILPIVRSVPLGGLSCTGYRERWGWEEQLERVDSL